MYLGLAKSFKQSKRAMPMYFYAKYIFYIKEWLSYQNSYLRGQLCSYLIISYVTVQISLISDIGQFSKGPFKNRFLEHLPSR